MSGCGVGYARAFIGVFRCVRGGGDWVCVCARDVGVDPRGVALREAGFTYQIADHRTPASTVVLPLIYFDRAQP